jgi:hypothetical protein
LTKLWNATPFDLPHASLFIKPENPTLVKRFISRMVEKQKNGEKRN